MPITTMTSRAFNQDTGAAKRAASQGPVFITDRGKPAHVLLSIDEFRRLTGGSNNILDLLAMPAEYADLELDIPMRTDHPRAADFD